MQQNYFLETWSSCLWESVVVYVGVNSLEEKTASYNWRLWNISTIWLALWQKVARRTRETESSVDLAKAAFQKKTPCTRQLGSDLPKGPVKCYIWSIAQYGAESRTLRKLEKSGKFWKVVLEKDRDQLGRSCEKWSITFSYGGNEYPTYNKKN
jgi:hypothetical protein